MEIRNRSLLVLLTHSFTAAIAAGLAFALVVAGATLVFARAQSLESSADRLTAVSTGHEFSGMITDSYCRARHQQDSDKNPEECTRSCVRHGAKYVLVDGDATYILAGNPTVLDRLAGQRARVRGTVDGDVLSVTAAAAQ